MFPRIEHADAVVNLGGTNRVALLFPGQGSQHAYMGRTLLGREPVFTASFLRTLSMSRYGQQAYRALLARRSDAIHEVECAQPLIFAMDFALGQMVKSWGVAPAAYLGHSAGELVAAAHSGMLSVKEAVSLVDDRILRASHAPRGGMLAVACGSDAIMEYLRGDVCLAADNAARQVMLAGSVPDLAEVKSLLEQDGMACAEVPATSPFHSPLMGEAADDHRGAYLGVMFRAPTVPVISGYTGAQMTSREWSDADFWAQQIVKPVLFRQALEALLAAGNYTLIEAGASQTLTSFARRTSPVRNGGSTIWPLLPVDETAGPSGCVEQLKDFLLKPRTTELAT
jgi:[acyl-carrier-protein] S-malonyltransferase